MSYTGLGWTGTITMTTPWGKENASITVPVEQAVNSAWPAIEQKLYAALPGLMDQALARAGTYVTEDLWPQLRPEMRAEIDRAVDEGEQVANDAVDEASKRAAILGSFVVTAIVAGAWWVGRKR